MVFAGGVFAESAAEITGQSESIRIAQVKVTTSSTMEKAAEVKADKKTEGSQQKAVQKEVKKAVQQEASAAKMPEEKGQPSPQLKAKRKMTSSPWSGMVYSWTEAGLAGSTPYTDWVLRLKYKLNDKWTLAFTFDLQTQWEESLNFDFFDPHVMLSSGNLGMLPWGLKTKGYVRAYLPLSQASSESDHIGVLRIGYTVTKPFGKFSLSYYAEPRFYFQSNSYTVGTDEAGLQKPDVLENRDGTRAIRYRHYFKGEYKLSDTVSVYSLFVLWHNWDHNASEEEGKYSSVVNAITETAVKYTGIKDILYCYRYYAIGSEFRK